MTHTPHDFNLRPIRADLDAQLQQVYKSMAYAAERNDGPAYTRLKAVARELRARLSEMGA